MTADLDRVLARVSQNPLFSVETGTVDERWMSLDQALHSDWLDRLCATYAETYPGLDQRGQGAFVVGRMSWVLATTLAACDLALGAVPKLTAASVWLNGESDRLRFRLPDIDMTPSSTDELRLLLVTLMTPFIEPIRQRCRLSKAAQWRLVADSVAAAWLLTGRRLNQEESAKLRALTILHEQPSELTNRQTGFTDVAVWEPDQSGQLKKHQQTYRTRGGCCRVYTSESHGYCSTCIHVKQDERHQRLSAALRHEVQAAH